MNEKTMIACYLIAVGKAMLVVNKSMTDLVCSQEHNNVILNFLVEEGVKPQDCREAMSVGYNALSPALVENFV